MQLSKVFWLQKHWWQWIVALRRWLNSMEPKKSNAYYMKGLRLIYFAATSEREASESECSLKL